MGYEFKRPDATAMERVLARHPADPEGAVAGTRTANGHT